MELYGLSMVRNEADIVGVNVRYHLAAGFDRMLVVDNDSEDGTDEVLRALSSKDPRVRWSRNSASSFRQGEVFTELAREAHAGGATWVVPVDADDFWHAPGGDIKKVLSKTEAVALRVGTIDFIQRRSQRKASPDALTHMTRRVPEPIGREHAHEMLGAGKISYVEMSRVPRWISRPSAITKMVRGAHSVEGVEGVREESAEIVCLHAPLRSFTTLEAKARSASRRGAKEEGRLGPGWHVSRWRKLQETSALEKEWAANSYAGGALDVYGEPHPVVYDPTLRNLVAPFVDRPPLWRRVLYGPARTRRGDRGYLT